MNKNIKSATKSERPSGSLPASVLDSLVTKDVRTGIEIVCGFGSYFGVPSARMFHSNQNVPIFLGADFLKEIIDHFWYQLDRKLATAPGPEKASPSRTDAATGIRVDVRIIFVGWEGFVTFHVSGQEEPVTTTLGFIEELRNHLQL